MQTKMYGREIIVEDTLIELLGVVHQNIYKRNFQRDELHPALIVSLQCNVKNDLQKETHVLVVEEGVSQNSWGSNLSNKSVNNHH